MRAVTVKSSPSRFDINRVARQARAWHFAGVGYRRVRSVANRADLPA